MGRFDSLTQLEEKPAKPTPLPRQTDAKVSEHQFASKPTNQQTSHPVPPVREVHPVLPVRPVPPGRDVLPVPPTKRVMKPRHPFDIYLDQYESLKQLADEDRRQGGLGSMSAMVREAIDTFIAKRNRKGK